MFLRPQCSLLVASECLFNASLPFARTVRKTSQIVKTFLPSLFRIAALRCAVGIGRRLPVRLCKVRAEIYIPHARTAMRAVQKCLLFLQEITSVIKKYLFAAAFWALGSNQHSLAVIRPARVLGQRVFVIQYAIYLVFYHCIDNLSARCKKPCS